MPVCAYGSSPQAGAPTFYTYDETFVGTIAPFPAGFLTLWAMGLDTSPQVTADL
jgi:hypothetical protein